MSIGFPPCQPYSAKTGSLSILGAKKRSAMTNIALMMKIDVKKIGFLLTFSSSDSRWRINRLATSKAAIRLYNAGADIIKVGIGPGSICTTRLVAGIGVPQLSAILSVRNGIKNKNVKIISDGGIKYSGDLAKAFAAGADAVMIGSLFAGTDEAPGKIIKKGGKLFKSFRGMGSVGAMNKGSADRYFQSKQKDTSKYVPEGVEGLSKYKGKVENVLPGMQAAFVDIGYDLNAFLPFSEIGSDEYIIEESGGKKGKNNKNFLTEYLNEENLIDLFRGYVSR